MFKNILKKYKEKKMTGKHCKNYTINDLYKIKENETTIMFDIFNSDEIKIRDFSLKNNKLHVTVYFDDVFSTIYTEESIDVEMYERGFYNNKYNTANKIIVTTKDLGKYGGFIKTMEHYLSMYRKREQKDNDGYSRKRKEEKEELNKIL